ncbi:MAG: GNAT family N-acetyltransferase [Clostridia bacterium]|nr:GNAT family N-acetyltransferase [Clostridia bacterium]MBR0421542.1 GNAT family N-acetyltransferase [Clostridia bacterium]
MKDIYKLTLKDLQPSQFYISERKLASVEAWFDPADLSNFEPIPVKELDGVPVITDGHTRAVAALRVGVDRVPLVWDTDELDWRLYRACVTACRRRGILSPADLLTRIISAEEYVEQWDAWCDRLHADIDAGVIQVVPYTKADIPDVLSFERRLREEEADWGWVIDDAYIAQVEKSFEGDTFRDALSYLAYLDGQVAGRIDACLIRSHFDGSTKAYLDWICVIKSYRHRGVGQALLERLRQELKARGVDTLIALTAANDEAQRFYKSVPDSCMRDVGIWIDV